MEKRRKVTGMRLLDGILFFLRKILLAILSVGPMPYHVAFIMDGNRRYAKKRKLALGEGHRDGFASLVSLLGYCYGCGIQCVTVYAFSIDNFRREPEEVRCLMDLMQEKIEELREERLVREYGVRIRFIGNLELLSEAVRASANRVMEVTAPHDKRELLVCVAYTSRDEIVRAVRESCERKLMADRGHGGREAWKGERESSSSSIDKQMEFPAITLADIESHMYMGVVPDPDIVIRSGGEGRLSNFLLWQTGACPLHAPSALWPELGLRHLIGSIIKFQRSYRYVEKIKKQF